MLYIQVLDNFLNITQVFKSPHSFSNTEGSLLCCLLGSLSLWTSVKKENKIVKED